MKLVDLTVFHQAAPSKYSSNSAFGYKYLFNSSEELSFKGNDKKNLNAFRKAANSILLGANSHSDNVILQNSIAKAKFAINPFLAIVYAIDNSEPLEADAWIKAACIKFKEVYTLSDLGELQTFIDSATKPFFILPYHLLEMLKNEAEWQLYKDYLNFTIKPATALKQPSSYIVSNQGTIACLTDYQISHVPLQHSRNYEQPFSLYGLMAYKLYQAIMTGTLKDEKA